MSHTHTHAHTHTFARARLNPICLNPKPETGCRQAQTLYAHSLAACRKQAAPNTVDRHPSHAGGGKKGGREEREAGHLDASSASSRGLDNHPMHPIREEEIHFVYGKAHFESVTSCHASSAWGIKSERGGGGANSGSGTREGAGMLAAARAFEEALAVNSRHLPSLEALALLHDTQGRSSGTHSEKSSLYGDCRR
jgi:hypothetical protein